MIFALGTFGCQRYCRVSWRHLLVKTRSQLVIELDVAEQVARFDERSAHRHVSLGLANRFIDRSGGVADLQSHIPQAVEQSLSDRLAPSRLFVGEQKQ